MDDPKMELSHGRGLRIARMGRLRMVFGLTLLLACLLGQAEASAQTAKWIWSPKVDGVAGEKAQGDCYFRSKFTLIKPDKAQIIFAAGDEYELYVNNRLVSKGESYGSENTLDVSSYVKPGVNLVAVKVSHLSSVQPGIALKVRIKERDETRWRSMVTNDTWKTRNQLVTGWTQNGYNDMGWLKARALAISSDLGRPKTAQTTQQTQPAPSTIASKAAGVSPASQTSTQSETVKKQAVPVAQVSTSAAQSKDIRETNIVGSAAERVAPVAPFVSALPESKSQSKSKSNRFELDSEFVIEQVLTAK